MSTEKQLQARVAELAAENERLRRLLGRTVESRDALARIRAICGLLHAQEPVNATKLASQFKVSRKTIHRDFQEVLERRDCNILHSKTCCDACAHLFILRRAQWTF